MRTIDLSPLYRSVVGFDRLAALLDAAASNEAASGYPPSNIERTAPAGSYIVERPGKEKTIVHVRVMDERRPGVVVRMRVYEIRDGKLVRQG